MKTEHPLLSDEDFILKMKDNMTMSIGTLKKENIFVDQMRQKNLKFELRNFTIHYSISTDRERKGKKINLENKIIKVFEKDLEENEHNQEYLNCKRKLNVIFDQNVEGIKVRSVNGEKGEGEKNSILLESLKKLCHTKQTYFLTSFVSV